MTVIYEEVRKLWIEWEIRIMILLSLLLQIILIHYGSQRKYRSNSGMRILVWSAYLSADWVATFTLGNIAKSHVFSGYQSLRPTDILQIFWAPFLLLHLGGPDTITAYSLEDNELWKRHLLQLIIQVVIASYVIFWSWSNSVLNVLAVMIFISGSAKFGERTYVLWSASTDTFKEDLLCAHPLKHVAERIVMKIRMRKRITEEGHSERITTTEDSREKQQAEDDHRIVEASFLLERFKYLFAGFTLRFSERNDCYDVIHQKSAVEAFKLIAIELGFMYDVLYTKATIIYSRWGIILRIIFLGTSISALVVFHTFIGLNAFDDVTDSCITYVLLGGAVGLEVYAFIALLSSDWKKLSLFPRKPWMTRIHSYIYRSDKRWSACLAQFSLVSYCLDDVQGRWFGLHKMPYVKDWIKEYPYLTWEEVTADMQGAIFDELLQKGNKNMDEFTDESCKALLARRGDHVLEKWSKLEEFRWSTVDIKFDHSVLVWHIATDICYFVDFNNCYNTEILLLERRKVSKLLSYYMLYLQVLFPFILHDKNGEMRYRDTCDQVKQFLKKEDEKRKTEICKKLIEKDNIARSDQSVLYDGWKLAKQLQSLESQADWDRTKKWTMISQVWIEMLTYAANRCTWKEHAQLLWKGGELLTHVRLLMTNLGLSEQFTEII